MTNTTLLSSSTLLLAVFLISCARQADPPRPQSPSTTPKPWFDNRLRAFFALNDQQAHQLAETYRLDVAPDIWGYFAAGQSGHWQKAAELYRNIYAHSNQNPKPTTLDPAVCNAVWPTVHETALALNQMSQWSEKYCLNFARRIIESVPPGSVYFGGSEPGRALITIMCKSQVRGDPFLILSPNHLVDPNYMNYLRAMYDSKIELPTDSALQQAFQAYHDDAVSRGFKNKLKPGENVTITNGQAFIQGIPAVAGVNAIMVRHTFNENPTHQFFLEWSYPLDWMEWAIPYLTPHGLILKLNHTELKELPAETIRQDHDYWTKLVAPMLGDWLRPETSLTTLTNFADQIYRQKNYTGFTGDRLCITNEWSRWTFANCRATIASLYTWRADHAASHELRTQLAAEADFAFRQAFALYPPGGEIIALYADFLSKQQRLSDLGFICETALRIAPEKSEQHTYIRNLLDCVKNASPPNTVEK